MRQKFAVNVSLYAAYSDSVERAHLAAPMWHTLKIFVCVCGAAFALHLRLVWHTIQLLVFFALIVAAVALRRDVPRRRYYDRKALSTYERTHLSALETKWHLTLVAYATWIAYGALAHDGRHAAQDMALIDGVMPPDFNSTLVVSTLRFVALLALSTASMSYSGTMFILRTATDEGARLRFVCALGVFFALLSLPPEGGVPQRLGVGGAVMRYAAFALLFAANEQWRLAVEHYAFVARLCSNSLSDEELSALHANSIASDGRRTLLVSNTSSASGGTEHNQHLPSDVVALERQLFPLSALSVLRSAWLLTAPSGVAAYAVSFLAVAIVIRHTKEWTRYTRARADRCMRAQYEHVMAARKQLATAADAVQKKRCSPDAMAAKETTTTPTLTPLQQAQKEALVLKALHEKKQSERAATLNGRTAKKELAKAAKSQSTASDSFFEQIINDNTICTDDDDDDDRTRGNKFSLFDDDDSEGV
jgi:hypothetical protein